MKALSERSGKFTDSVIRRMTRISNRVGAINLAQGFPDFDPPKALTNRLQEVASSGPHQYALTMGAKNFREAVAAKQAHFYQVDYDPDREITVTCGSTEAMIASVEAVTNPGDELVIFSPFYENYGADAILSGADPVYVPLQPPDFTFDPEELERALSRPKVKALILCNPSNPCGKVFTAEELTLIADLTGKYDLYVITDEVYEHIVYAPHRHIHFASLPGMKERTITCGSLSKTYSITGWRLGFALAPPEITECLIKVHDFLTVCAAAPLMEAAVAGLSLGDDYYRELTETYTNKRALFTAGLRNLGLTFSEPEGAYYILLDISEFGYGDDHEFARDLAEKVGVGAVPGSSFFKTPENRFVRLHFAKEDVTLRAALDRLQDIGKLKK